jgi:hypothetical protein
MVEPSAPPPQGDESCARGVSAAPRIWQFRESLHFCQCGEPSSFGCQSQRETKSCPACSLLATKLYAMSLRVYRGISAVEARCQAITGSQLQAMSPSTLRMGIST